MIRLRRTAAAPAAACASLATIFALSACATPSTRVVRLDDGVATTVSVEELVRKYPLAADENIRATSLNQTESLSCHFIQIRDRESPHVHRDHDLVVTLLSGAGTLTVGERKVPMRAGDAALVPRNIRHFFVNHGEVPAAAFVTFAPPYDGTDNIPTD